MNDIDRIIKLAEVIVQDRDKPARVLACAQDIGHRLASSESLRCNRCHHRLRDHHGADGAVAR